MEYARNNANEKVGQLIKITLKLIIIFLNHYMRLDCWGTGDVGGLAIPLKF